MLQGIPAACGSSFDRSRSSALQRIQSVSCELTVRRHGVSTFSSNTSGRSLFQHRICSAVASEPGSPCGCARLAPVVRQVWGSRLSARFRVFRVGLSFAFARGRPEPGGELQRVDDAMTRPPRALVP